MDYAVFEKNQDDEFFQIKESSKEFSRIIFPEFVSSRLLLDSEEHFDLYSTTKQCWFRFFPIKQSENSIAVWVTNVDDIKKSELRLFNMLELFDDIIFELNDELVYTDVITSNDSKLIYKKEEIIGKRLNELFSDSLCDQFKDLFNRVLESNSKQRLEYSVEINGSTRYFRATVSRKQKEDNEFYYFASIADITEETLVKQANKFHREFEELLVNCTSLLIQSTEGTLDSAIDDVLKKIGEFSNVDRSYLFHFDETYDTASNTHEWAAEGVTREKENLQGVPTEIFPQWMIKLQKNEEVYIPDVSQLPEDWSGEKEILEPQGIKSVIVLPVQINGKLYGFMGFDAVSHYMTWDTSSRQLLLILADNLGSVIHRIEQNKELIKTTEEAQRLAIEATAANKAKSEFLANMSHEIRTPLNGVIGFADLLTLTKMDNVQEQYVKNLRDSARSLLDLINQVLDFSKIEAGRMELDLDRCDLQEVIENACMLVRHSAGVKNLNFQLHIHENVPQMIIGDAVRLRQIMVNLLSNAIKFTPSGSVVFRVSVVSDEDGPAHPKIRFEVKDTGIGINEEQRKFIFKAFVQADTSTTKKYGGTGLGLVISNNLLEMMGSKLELSSKIGEGSKFWFDLNLPVLTEEIKAAPKIIGIRKVAVICDSSDFLGMIRSTLFEQDIEIHVFDVSSTTLSKLETLDKMDLIIVSENAEGDEQCKLIESIRVSRSIDLALTPVLLYFISDRPIIHSVMYRAGYDFILQKPVLKNEFLDTLKAVSLKNQDRTQLPIESNEVKQKISSSPDILVVEDNEVNLLLTKILVNQIIPGANITEAYNGVQALDRLRQGSFDLILMDIQMPEMDGYEAIKILRHEGIKTPVVALTANVVMGEKEKCLSVGADDYVSKPLERSAFRDVLLKYVK